MSTIRRASHLRGARFCIHLCIAIGLAIAAGRVAAQSLPARGDGKLQMHEEMLQLAGRMAKLRPALANDANARSEHARLQARYDRLNLRLGGDDPGHAASLTPVTGAGGAPFGGIAGAPAPPPSCTGSSATFTNATPLPIPIASALVTSTMNVSGAGSVIYDVNVETFITHTFNADLDITLTSPAGTVVTLTTDNGGPNANVFNGTVWDDSADPDGDPLDDFNDGLVTDHFYVDATPALALAPEEALGAFIGENPNGTWTLTISDDAELDGGMLNSWELAIQTINAMPAVTTQIFSSGAMGNFDNGLLNSNLAVTAAQPIIWDVDFETNLTHTSCADLGFTLSAPNGTAVTLSTDNGGANADVFNGTLFDVDANSGGQVPYEFNDGLTTDHEYQRKGGAVATLAPEESLSAFTGGAASGTWTLRMSDDTFGNGGTINGWSIHLRTIASAVSPATFTFTNTTPVVIPDTAGNVLVSSTINVTGMGDYLHDLDVTTLLNHSFNEDLDITLTSPVGTVATLTTDNGGSNDDVFGNTLWDDDANPAGQVPYPDNPGLVSDRAYADFVTASPLAPEEALGAFIGENPNGAWTLSISDDFGSEDAGVLNSWSLHVNTLSSAPADDAPVAASNNAPVAISSGAPSVVSSNINVGGANGYVCDVNVTTNITHTFNGDLDITLRSPAGTIVTLTTDNGGVNDNVFNGTLWNDEANPAGTLPYETNNGLVGDHNYVNGVLASPLVPEEALAAFIGENPNGMWTLTISDDATDDGGSLNSWSLQITTCSCGPTPCPGDINSDNIVDVNDLLLLIGAWGATGANAADLNNDLVVDVNDLLILIGAWGAC